jgi:hypothetical protein
MKLLCFHIILLFTLLTVKLQAQLSPGDLSRAHAHLEGIGKCTECHILGKKVANNKCLNCHKEIGTLIDLNAGYHASREVKGKECASCHSDHNGRNFDMARFDEDAFDHALTGYLLKGKHEIIDCRQCHIPDFVEDPDLKKRTETFLGLDQECLSCHEDYHQRTLSSDCASCHDNNAFSPAARFNHDDTEFPLLGEHQSLDCRVCHEKEIRNGRDFQRFAGISFSNCSSCHEDVHDGRLGVNCKECHVERSFLAMEGLMRFDHDNTHFPLKGKHRPLDCAQCHNLDASANMVFSDRKGVEPKDCAICHRDVHENKFGQDCAECHNERSFHTSSSQENFNHSLTGFELTGKHQNVDCRKCHSGSFVDPLPHRLCGACHEDYHHNQFASAAIGFKSPDCIACHIVDGFEYTTYTIELHNTSKFPLLDAHAATPCFACHKTDGDWRFREIGQNCVDCHENVHGDDIDRKYYPDQACERCHSSTTWADNHFDHSQTTFALAGAHNKQECSACHQPDETHKTGKFRGTPAACEACHEDQHYQQFEINGVTTCSRCHGLKYWKIDRFNHNRTDFRLIGKHVRVACEACHQEIEVNGVTFVRYKFESFECVVCHH